MLTKISNDFYIDLEDVTLIRRDGEFFYVHLKNLKEPLIMNADSCAWLQREVDIYIQSNK